MTDEYKQALIKAQAQLAEVDERRTILLRLVETLKGMVQDELYELTPPPDYEPEGVTAEVRKILSLTSTYLAPTQIRDALIQRGFSKANPKTLLISVHTVIGRIEDELDYIERDGKRAYKAKANVSNRTTLGDFVKLLNLPSAEQLEQVKNAYIAQFSALAQQMKELEKKK